MFCHQRNGFHENHLGISSSRFRPNLEEKNVTKIMRGTCEPERLKPH